MGLANEFHTKTVDPWPNYHSGASGDYQPVLVEVPVHELLRTNQTASGRIEWFPADLHEGLVSAKSPFATAIARGRSTATGRHFNLAAVIDGERGPDGRPMGRAVAESTFHHSPTTTVNASIRRQTGATTRAEPTRRRPVG